MATQAGAVPAVLATTAADGHLIDPGAPDRCLAERPRARLLLLCSSSSPTGGVRSWARLAATAAVLDRHPRVVVLADESSSGWSAVATGPAPCSRHCPA